MSKKKPSKQSAALRRYAEKGKKQMDPAEFQTLTFGLDQAQIGKLAGVSLATVRRWMAGSTPISYAVQHLFRLRSYGVVGEDLAGFYRRQVRLEANMGMALVRIAG